MVSANAVNLGHGCHIAGDDGDSSACRSVLADPGDSTYWNCGLPEFSGVYGGYYVRHKTCIVVNGNYTQAVVIVENYAGYAITIEAPQVQLYQAPGKLIYNRFCHESTLNSGRTTACFGPTTWRACGTRVQAQAVVTYGRAEALQANSWSTEMCT